MENDDDADNDGDTTNDDVVHKSIMKAMMMTEGALQPSGSHACEALAKLITSIAVISACCRCWMT